MTWTLVGERHQTLERHVIVFFISFFIKFDISPNSQKSPAMKIETLGMRGYGGTPNRTEGCDDSHAREVVSQRRRLQTHGWSEMSSGSFDLRRRITKMCDCGIEAHLATSWIRDNPGRRFYGCSLFKVWLFASLHPCFMYCEGWFWHFIFSHISKFMVGEYASSLNGLMMLRMQGRIKLLLCYQGRLKCWEKKSPSRIRVWSLVGLWFCV